MIKPLNALTSSFAALACSSASVFGASLALTEGPSDANNGYGTDVYVNFPSVYTTGQYTLRWMQNVPSTVDTIQPIYVSQGLMPSDFRTGAFPSNNGITGTVGSVSLTRNVWQEHVFTIDLDADTYSHDFNGSNVTPAGTTWDGQADDGNPPALASINIWMGNSGGGANLDGIDGSVLVDDFSLADGDGNILWSEDFEGGLGTFVDFGGAVAPTVIPEASTTLLGFLAFFFLTGRRSRK